MSRRSLFVSTLILTVAGVAGLLYCVLVMSPYDESGGLSATALLLFFASLFMATAAAGSLLALGLHGRWPALAGGRAAGRRRTGWDGPPPAEAALRQGILLGLVVATLTALSILRILDITFALVTLLVAGLIEGFAQMRR